MSKTLSVLFVILTLVSCGKSGGGSSSQTSAAQTAENSVKLEQNSPDKDVPQDALNFEVNLSLNNFEGHQENKILVASDLIKKVVASAEFKNRILNHKVNGKKRFVDSGGLSNAEIYQKILDGSEELTPGVDNTMDLELETFIERTNTVGYTMTNSETIWMNERFLDANTPAKVTTNMMHEWLHKLGFSHAVKATSSRRHSVPYAVGYIVAELAARL